MRVATQSVVVTVTDVVTMDVGERRVSPPSQEDFVVLGNEDGHFFTQTEVGLLEPGQLVKVIVCWFSKEARLLED